MLMNSHCPATYLKLGLMIRSSIAPMQCPLSVDWMIESKALITYRWGARVPSRGESPCASG